MSERAGRARAGAAPDDAADAGDVVEGTATTTMTKDYMGRALVTPGTVAKDYSGRLCLAGDLDYMGVALAE